MRLTNRSAEVYVPDGSPVEQALERTTHMGIGTHPDDLEIMSYHGILECFGKDDEWFTGVVVTDGAGSPRDGLYARYTDEEMRGVRRVEQRKAAMIGQYSAVVMLDYPSSAVKNAANREVVEDIKRVVEAARPSVMYTHNLADKHDTHVAVVLRVVQALRELPPDARPKALYGCETWRDLDWLCDADKVVFDVAAHENLAASLLGVFDSQIAGGKRYDLATMGRRRAHATYLESHGTDVTTAAIFAVDLTPLVTDPTLDIKSYADGFVHRLARDVAARLDKML